MACGASRRCEVVRSRVMVGLWIAGSLILLLFLPQIPGCVMANTPKTGRVIDAATGKGLAHVAVIAAAEFNAQNLIHGTNSSCRYRIIAYTDADGSYWIHNTWLDLAFGLPGTDPRLRWVVTAFKPGYAIEGDEGAWTFDEYGAAKKWPASVIWSPSSWWLGVVVRVNPIRMTPVQLSLKEAAVYYGNIISAGACNSAMPLSVEERELRKTGYDIFLPKVCEMPPDTEMDMTEADAFSAFTYHIERSDVSLRRLEPSGFQDLYRHPVFHAGNVCQSLIAGGSP